MGPFVAGMLAASGLLVGGCGLVADASATKEVMNNCFDAVEAGAENAGFTLGPNDEQLVLSVMIGCLEDPEQDDSLRMRCTEPPSVSCMFEEVGGTSVSLDLTEAVRERLNGTD